MTTLSGNIHGADFVNDGVQRTAAFTAETGKAYFIKTDAGAFQIELPVLAAGVRVMLLDTTGFWNTNSPTVVDNGGTGFNGVSGSPLELDVGGSWIEFSANVDDNQWEVRGPTAASISDATDTASGLLPPPTLMSDELATVLGFKQYLHATDLTLTTSAPSPTFQRGVLIPYQMQDGTWRLKFNIGLTHSSSTGFNVTIPGVSFVSVASADQAFTVTANTNTVTTRARALNASGNLNSQFSSGVSATALTGDVELTGKPSWAI